MTDRRNQDAILSEYDNAAGVFRDLSATAASLLEKIVAGAGMQIHSITQRCKDRESLARKLSKSDKDYVQLSDVTDIAAVRITTYFAEDVDRIAKIIESEFVIDIDRSIDKRVVLDPDRFGYQSLHYVVSLSDDRSRLPEYSRFTSKQFEIQVRSILQHAWAEIEHDLGYKSAAGVPREIRRRFSRIAGLLELADSEFAAIRKELQTYAANVAQDIREKPDTVGIDKISLEALVKTPTAAVRQLSRIVANAAAAELEPISEQLLDHNITMLGFVNVTSIQELEDLASARKTIVAKFARGWLGSSRYKTLHEGIGIMYLAYVLLAERADKPAIQRFAKAVRLSSNSGAAIEDRILDVYHAAIEAA